MVGIALLRQTDPDAGSSIVRNVAYLLLISRICSRRCVYSQYQCSPSMRDFVAYAVKPGNCRLIETMRRCRRSERGVER